IDGEVVELALFDTAGQDDYDRLRPLAYSGAHVVLICFSIGSPDTLENVYEKWVPEVEHYCPSVPILVVGCQSDLRNDSPTVQLLLLMGQTPTTLEMGKAAARQAGAEQYLECSSKDDEGVVEVFRQAAKASAHLRQTVTRHLLFVGDSNSDIIKDTLKMPVRANIDTQSVKLVLLDTLSGSTGDDSVRITDYSAAHAVILCFSVDQLDSLRNVRDRWVPEIFHLCRNVPIFVIGCKVDQREDALSLQQGKVLTTPEDGQKIAKQIGAEMYLECSAKTNEGVDAVFEHAARAALVAGGKSKGGSTSFSLRRAVGRLLS
ncbi:hypothetical protein FRC17_005994, partial [Serendipita sp. 399]